MSDTFDVVEDGKGYKIENGKVVEAAVLKTAYYGDCPNPECKEHGVTKYDLNHDAKCDECKTSMRVVYPEKKDEDKKKDSSFAIGDRVEAEGKLGKVMLTYSTMYGDTATVRFDDGESESYITADLKHSDIESVDYDSPVDALIAEFESYESLPGFTANEIDHKTAAAQSLNVRARALVSDKKLPLSQLVKLDNIVTATATDVLDLHEASALLVGAESLALRNPFVIQTNGGAAEPFGYHGSEDVSWLGLLEEDEAPAAEESDARLAKVANAFVDYYEPSQLRDPQFVSRAVEMQKAYEPLLREPNHLETFRGLVDTARHERLARVAKTASKPEESVDLATFDTSSLFLGD